ncbi:hypothetical protein FisN_22Hh008 [Fistulifera solaris]|uniref:SYO1-like TPR repeats domain-containing protein n=1 Tax=Fistulifera solaris TaxID=1519565 RepID=A0A1Z5K2Q2_FISSO|nr:hypothetical protein FisN_22Hh008 [Fistulifera solaris]|eukprot:GAX20442.1 hypothetical protein FisN_22Hh008 [Fistulifera solaris]
MGKNAKRKHRRKQDKKPEDERVVHEGPSIVAKLRHNDAKLRHAALAALVHTSSTMHPSILQAVRDQLMDRSHTECASMAAACLSNFLAFSLEKDDAYHVLTAGWVLLLVERLRDCYQQIESSNSGTTVLSSTQLYLLWELAERCWTCLVHLVENNPLAMERLLRSASLQQDVMQLLVSSLHLKCSADHQTLADALHITASRCLHSMWDDNGELIAAWAVTPTVQQSLELLISFLRDTASTTARLHVIGAWFSFWSWTQLHPYQWGTIQPSTVLHDCLTILRQTLVWDAPARAVQISHLLALFQTFQKEEADEVLEKQIVSEQQKKKEPAKLIARRLKEKRKQDESHPKASTTETSIDSVMQEEASMDWESALDHWLSSIRPLQLALEITANLSVGGSPLNEVGDDDDDELMVESHLHGNAQLLQLLLDTGVPDCIVDLMRQLYQPIWGFGGLLDAPAAIRGAIGDLQSKVAVCVGHCVTSLQDSHRSWNVDAVALWHHLTQVSRAAADENATESLFASMVMTLQSAKGNVILQSFELKDVEFLLDQLKQTKSTVAARDLICMLGIILCSSFERDGFRYHTSEVNETVAKTLVDMGANAAERQCAIIMSETFRVLMDVYGNDDCFPQNFDSLNVLGYFQKYVPAFKQCIHMSRDASPDDIMQWKETASNASRFIQYKKGYGN